MTEKVIYIADDGTEFDYEDECRNYETVQDILPLFENVQMWDCCEKPIPTPICWDDIKSTLEDLHYIRGANLESLWDAIYEANLEVEMLDYDSFREEVQNADENDLLMFDRDLDNWVNVNYLFNEYRKILKNFS